LLLGFQVTSNQPEIASVKIDEADKDKRKKFPNGLLKEQRFRRIGILSAVRSGNSKRLHPIYSDDATLPLSGFPPISLLKVSAGPAGRAACLFQARDGSGRCGSIKNTCSTPMAIKQKVQTCTLTKR
jgi:hypothetical protein